MAKYVDKVHVQTPTKKFRNFDLSCQQLTTQFFMRLNVVYAKEFPKANINVNLKSYARMQPLLRPVLGSVQVHNRAFFVPFRVVWDLFPNFLVGAPVNTDTGTKIVNQVPYLYPKDIIEFLRSYSSVVLDSSKPYDYFDPLNNTYRVLNYQGRHYYKIFRQLGYGFNTGAEVNQSEAMSLLPLLCFCKVFLDWYFPGQFAHTGMYASLEGIFNRRFTYRASQADLQVLLESTRCTFYGNDYFTAAWESPVAPVASTFDMSIVIPDITNNANNSGAPRSMFVTNSDISLGSPSNPNWIPSNGTPYVAGSSTVSQNNMSGVFTQYVDDSLKALSNYQKRHQLVGARVLDRYLADFKVQLSAEVLKRSIYCGSQSFPIQFSDVMSNSDTIQQTEVGYTGAQLGDYAGKGIAYDGAGTFECSTEEYGYFLILNDVTPDVAYFEGIDRNILHNTPLQFFQGQFEDLGTQPIRQCELALDGANYTDIFGFAPRYAEYKVGRDSVTGLFNLGSVNKGLLSWSTARLVTAQGHSFNFMRGDDSWQYARIFYGSTLKPEDELDKFIFVHRINIKASMQMSPLYDTYEFDEPEGDYIEIQANGTQFK